MALSDSVMLRGVHSLALDAKGRIAVPSRYRSMLEAASANQLVITIDTESKCLLIYPLSEWELVQEKISSLSSFNKAARRLQRLLLGYATDVEIDGSGRLLISGPLREHAELEKKVVLLGQGNKFELWSESIWQQTRDAYIAEAGSDATMTEELEQISL
ncbi:division/cell wall cluster transcriptional repressor MraZ [Reinekea thalattae]|uniref:Transcriptional regulator MraZ n=1 Tax=Reinekea thalattae TaxID=2593301 RepID=A0A5C8Z4Z5_9GAMM|nr:division/cell wall cluster transcriptional repressor MraZ [Reinekea thalattae]TXR51990.1 division/cell wall cluster transcriptional repressor MraZ [Reinekea thalattae]